MSIKKIAQNCGVSPSTVSRVLRGVDLKYASEAVRQRIFEEARRIGYVPNVNAQALKKAAASAAPRCIAIVLGRGESLESNHFFLTLAQTAQVEILRSGCRLGPVLSAVRELDKVLAMENVNGVAVIGRCSDAIMKKIHRCFPHFVYIGCNPANEQYDQVISSGYDAAEIAVTKLIYSGCKRIGYVGGQELSQRYLGYVDTIRRFNLPIDRKLVFGQPFNWERLVNNCFLQDEPVDALFFNTIGDAVEMLAYLKKRLPDARLPALIAVEDNAVPLNCKPMLTTIQMPAEEMGRMAIRILLDRMEGGHREGITLNFHCSYVERESFRQHFPI